MFYTTCFPGFSGHVFNNCFVSFDETHELDTGKAVGKEKLKNGGDYKVYLSHVTCIYTL